MSRRKLPLESPHWWPLSRALEHRSERMGADQLAIWDFNQALEAGQLQAMVRRRDDCEVLAASAWKSDFYVTPKIQLIPSSAGRFRLCSIGMTVWSRKLGGRIPWHWFFVWRPDYEKIFPGAATPPAEPRARSPEVPETRGRKPVHDRADLQSVALFLALQRKQGAPKKRPVEIVDGLREWCQQNKRKVPADSTLHEIVAAALRIKSTLKS